MSNLKYHAFFESETLLPLFCSRQCSTGVSKVVISPEVPTVSSRRCNAVWSVEAHSCNISTSLRGGEYARGLGFDVETKGAAIVILKQFEVQEKIHAKIVHAVMVLVLHSLAGLQTASKEAFQSQMTKVLVAACCCDLHIFSAIAMESVDTNGLEFAHGCLTTVSSWEVHFHVIVGMARPNVVNHRGFIGGSICICEDEGILVHGTMKVASCTKQLDLYSVKHCICKGRAIEALPWDLDSLSSSFLRMGSTKSFQDCYPIPCHDAALCIHTDVWKQRCPR